MWGNNSNESAVHPKAHEQSILVFTLGSLFRPIKWRWLKICTLLLSMQTGIQLKSQNLVPNPSFESYDSLRCTWLYDPNYKFSDYVRDWFSVDDRLSSPDLFNLSLNRSCETHPFTTSAHRVGGETPRNGITMVAIVFDPPSVPVLGSEYLSVELKSPLETGKKYYGEMHVSLSNLSLYGTNNLGMYFSDTLISAMPDGKLDYEAQIIDTNVITDTAGWLKISGLFRASSPMRYLVIGGFRAEENIQFDSARTSDFQRALNMCYYFLDDILVRKVSPVVSNDTIICAGDTISLFASGDSLLGWAKSSAPNQIISPDSILRVAPSESTTYLFYNRWDTTSVTVDIYPEFEFVPFKDTTLCFGETLEIDASTPYVEIYRWHNGSSNSTINIRNSGNYWLELNHPCGKASDTATVEFINCSELEMPNVFSPNQDGINDFFKPISVKYINQGQLSIYNRLGLKVYENPLEAEGWNGQHNNLDCPEGVYYWVATFKDNKDRIISQKGFLNLSR